MLQLISSQLDMDRMDYLKRDSFYTGVAEGNINSDRLIQMLNVVDDVLFTITEAQLKSKKGKPIVILMKTQMGFGVDYMMGTHKWHGNAPNDAQLEAALAQLEETLGDY